MIFSCQAKWTAPEKNNKCVTIFAVVAVKPDVWYSYEGPLSKRICEDRRKADDMQPTENDNCQVCEDARYKVWKTLLNKLARALLSEISFDKKRIDRSTDNTKLILSNCFSFSYS